MSKSENASGAHVPCIDLLDYPPPPQPPPCRLILESGGAGVCSACGSSLKKEHWLFGKKVCIQPLCKSNAGLHGAPGASTTKED